MLPLHHRPLIPGILAALPSTVHLKARELILDPQPLILNTYLMQKISDLEQAYEYDKQRLEQTEIPIVTVSASYKEDLKGFYGLPEKEFITDIVFSRAHYSMALAIAIAACGKHLHPEKAWIVDPTNYVNAKEWNKVLFTQAVGKALARQSLLKYFKDLIDKFGRNKLPILKSITNPLLYVTQNVQRPILSMHIAAGNILAEQGKQIYQMVTDPHVREDYLNEAERDNIKFLVFDERTKFEFLEKASILHKQVDPKRVIVTGPPVDPRIIAARKQKTAWRRGPLRLCLTTGGLGTNIYEIKTILKQLLPELRKRPSPYQLLIYAGTQGDIFRLIKRLAAEEKVALNHIKGKEELTSWLQSHSANPQIDPSQPIKKKRLETNLNIIYHPQIVDANELLTYYAFPWSHGFITKPSGDMAYDAVASGSFLLTLKEWGEWEHNIRELFEQKDIARKADAKHIVAQLTALTSTKGQTESWIEQAQNNAFKIDKLFLSGAENIVKLLRK